MFCFDCTGGIQWGLICAVLVYRWVLQVICFVACMVICLFAVYAFGGFVGSCVCGLVFVFGVVICCGVVFVLILVKRAFWCWFVLSGYFCRFGYFWCISLICFVCWLLFWSCF